MSKPCTSCGGLECGQETVEDGSYDLGHDVTVTVRGGKAALFNASFPCDWVKIADESLHRATQLCQRARRWKQIARLALEASRPQDKDSRP